jgi:hypothetical protein
MSETVSNLVEMYQPEKFKIKSDHGDGYYDYYLHRCPQVTGIIGRLAFKINEAQAQAAEIARLEKALELACGLLKKLECLDCPVCDLECDKHFKAHYLQAAKEAIDE